ncbi:fimbria/pilus outer membrane usher protein [Edwardsiella piscicida]|nr:fimbria/pilus outer membrane usher protein [Edwardsiella piscicida]
MAVDRVPSTQNEVGLNGRVFDSRLNWDVRERVVSGNGASNQDNSNLSLRWYGTYGKLSGGYGYSKTNRQMNVGIQGGMVIHRHGVTGCTTL